MRYVVVDLEATCWEGRSEREPMEIIEIGALLLASSAGPVVQEFASFVRPVLSPRLSDFCQQLTAIRQEDVDHADDFAAVFPRFFDWIGPEPFVGCSWGRYDLNQLHLDCARHGLPFPEAMTRHINLKQEFARMKGLRPMGMKQALRRLGWPLVGQHHRALDDARNIGKLACLILPVGEAAMPGGG